MACHRYGVSGYCLLPALAILLAIATRPSQAQTVNVASLAVTITNGEVTQEGSQHSFTFNAVITLEGTAADAMGIMNRWGLAVTVENGTSTCLANTTLTLTPAQAGVAIAAGRSGTIADVTTGNLDLSGCLCSSVTQLKVTLSSPIYMLTGVLEDTATFLCRGLLGTSLTTLTGGSSLVENANGQTVTLTVIGNSESQGRSIQGGMTYWAAEVFLAKGTVNSYTQIGTRVPATLPSAIANIGWSSGGTLTLTGVSAMLDLNGVGSCDDINLVCVSLMRNPTSTLMFTIEGGSITSCAPVSCIGVLINQVIPSFTMATMIRQGEQNNNLGVTVTIKADPTKASLTGSGLWFASAFGNANANCMNPTKVPATVAPLTQNAADYGLDTAGQSVWPMITVSLNMVGAGCNDAMYLCIEVRKGADPMPPFSLSFSPSFAKYGAVQMECVGLTVMSGMLSVNPVTQLAAFKVNHNIQFDATFTSSPTSGGVSGTNLWDLMVFPAQNADGSGRTGPASAVTLQTSHLNTAFPGSGGSLSLTGLTAVIQLEANACSTYNYLCSRLSKNSAAIPDFIISTPVQPSCSMLSCKNVLLTSTTISPSTGASPNGLPLFEGKSSQVIYFDATLNSEVTGGSVPSGTNHWQFTVSPGAAVAALTQQQKDSPLTAGTPLTFTRIMATLDLTNQSCTSLGQVCAEVMRSSDDTLGFQLDSSATQNTECFTPTCEGVKITALVINDGVTNFALKEGAQGHMLTFSVTATVDANFGSVRGTNKLWDILVYLSMDQQQDLTVSSPASLTGWQTQDLIAGTEGTFNNVQVTLNLDSTCERMQFLCIELRKASGQTFKLDAGSNVLKTCKPVSACNGVEIANTAVAITNGGPVVEGVASNSPTVGVSITFTATSASVTGSSFWNVTIYGSTSEAGIGNRTAEQTSVTSGNPAALTTVNCDPITWNVDMTNLLCSAITHICVQVEKSSDAPFSLLPTSSLKCSPLQCEGIVITSEDFALSSNIIYEARDTQSLTATAISANADGNGASIPDSAATDIWDIMLFLNSAANGNGTTFASASPTNPKPAERNQGVNSTNPLMFSDYTFSLSTTSLLCGAALYVCLEISESPSASKDYSITFPPSPTCKEITCKGAAFMSASVAAPPTTKLIENEPGHPVVLTFNAVTAPDTATLTTGADFWLLKGFASKMADGTGERYGEHNIGLTNNQKITALNADSTVQFPNVNGVLDLRGFVCPGVRGYLCAELQRDPSSLPPFTIQGSPSPLVACLEVECQGVLIDNIALSGLPTAIIERGTEPVTLTATVNVGGADASGTMLWEMSASLLDGTTLLSTVPVDLGQQANNDVINGQPITFSDVTLPFDLSQLLCPSNGTVTLCIDLSRAGGSNANFTVTGATQQCTDVPCRGVVIVQSSATATSGDLKEGRASNPIVLDLSFTSSPTGASINGNGLWSLTVFGNSQENGLGPRMSDVMATLQGNDVSFPLANGSSVEFNSVMATLDLSPNLVCEKVRWVCAELKKQASVDFSLMSENNAHIACTNLNCQGVQISSTTLVLDMANSMFKEDSGSSALTLAQVDLTSAPGSSILPQFLNSYFKVVVFGSPVAGTSQTKVAVTVVDTTNQFIQLLLGDPAIFSQLGTTLNLTGVFCTDLNYLCVEVSRGDTPPFDFKLEGVPNANSLIGCQAVTCKGLRVTGGTFNVISDLLEGVPVFSLSVQVTFSTIDTGASVRAGGSNLFRLEAFVASNVTGVTDPKTPNQIVALPSGSESQPVMAGGMIDFVGAIAMLDTTTWTCQTENFICIRLVKDPMASVNYKLEGWVDTGSGMGYNDATKLLTCQPINCQGVNISDVAIQTSGQTSSFQERDGETSFTVDVAITAAADAGSVVGTGLWNVTFALNSQGDGNGNTFGTLSVATLSEENSNKGVAAGSTTTLTGVKVTMPAVADILCSVTYPFYLCVKVEKASGSSPDFTIMTIDWHCVPVTCYPVIINDIQFEVTLPTHILENVDNYLHVDLHITTDLNSADISGTGLWNSLSFQIRDTGNAVTPLNATGNYWTSGRENTALIANQTVDFVNIFPVQITPTGVLCDNLDELCLTFEKGNTPVPQFDLNFTTPNDVCIPVTCKGVEIVSTVISNVVDGSTVKERSSSVSVILSTLSVSAGDAASIAGTDLWAVSYYYTPHANGDEDPVIGKDTFPLSPTNINAKLDAGQNLALTNLESSIDLSNLVCPAGGLWLCARLQRHVNPSPLFTLSAKNGDNSVFIGCQSVTCRGVQFEDTTVIVDTGGFIPVENALSHTVRFLFEAMSTLPGASVNGTGLWQLKVFANRRADGSHHRKAYELPVALTTEQTNAQLLAGSILSFSGLTITLNLLNTECRQTPYFCAQIQKGVNPTPEFSLQGIPDDNTLITCAPLDCNGVKIATFDLTNTGGNILHENEDNQMFSFDVVLTSDATKAAIAGENLWEFKAYLNNHEDCLGDAEEVALTNAIIQLGEEDQNLTNGSSITFNVDVPLDYQMKCPPWPKVYLCLEVHVGAGTSKDFTLFGEIVKGVEVQCKGVEVTNTAISEVNSGSRIVESDAEVTFDLNLRISSNTDGSSISGLGLWSVDIFTSDTESCTTVTSQQVTSSLSVSNLNKPLSAGALFLMNNVRATVPLPDALCENINYVCAEWSKGMGASPNFTLVPIPDQTALIASSAIECKGLHILSTRLSLRMGEPLISNEPRHPITFDFDFQTDSNGASVIDPVNLFRLQVAATAIPSRDGVVASLHQVTVPYSPPSMIDIIAGRLYVIPVEAELNLMGAKCDEVPYVCVTLTKGLNAEPRFTLTPVISDPVLTTCTQRLDCRGIRIVSEQLTINSGIPFVEHATNNPVDLTVTLTSDSAGGSAIGVNLWSAEVKLSNDDPLAPGTVFRANTSGILTGNDASKDLVKGGTIELNIVADLNLDGLSCSDVRYLIVVITNPNADPAFTLEWRNSSSVVVTQLFTCTGVSLSPNSLIDSSVSLLRELAATSNVSFSVSVLASPTSATVSGMDLWKTTVFLSADQNGAGTRQAETEAVLDSTQGAVPVVAGMVSGINGVTVTLTTANLYCRDMAYLCVEVWRGSAAQPYYNIESPTTQSGLRQCIATKCNGVQVMSVASTIITNYPLIEQRPNQEVRLELNITTSPTSAGINGDNLWRATVFVTSQADGSGTRRSEREATISASQSGRDLNPASVLTLENLIATMDFTGIGCAEMRYICVTLGKGAGALPDFSLTGLPNDNSLTDCIETNCISIAIQSGSLTLGSNELLESDNSATFMLDASFNPWSNSRSLQADRSWDLYVFASNCSDGCGVESARVKASLTTAQQNQGVTVGTPLTFDGLMATLDLTGINCADTTHLCVRLATQAGVPFVLGGYPTSASLVSCVELKCFTKTVDLYATEVTDRKISVAFSEAFGDFDLYVLRYSPPDGITNSPFSIPRNLQRALDFSQLVPGQLYTIELTLMDGANTKGGPFVLKKRTKPDAVTLQLESVTSSELTVSWDAASGVFEYYTLILDPSDNGLPRTPFNVYPNQNRELTFTGLLTARSYNVTIITVSGNVPSLPSTVLANTEPSRPTLTSTGRAETTIDLQWFIDRSYIVDHYEVTYDPVSTSTQPLILPTEADRTTLIDLVPGRFYMISLVAVSNLAGNQVLRSTPAMVSIRTRPVAPTNITHTPTETSIRVEWPSSVGELDFYTVTFSPSVNLGETKVLKDAPRDLLFQGLEVASEYTVTITAHIENIDENQASVPIQRVFYTLPHTPGPLSIVKVTTTTIEFQWQDAAGPRDGYEVIFVPNEPEFNPQSPFFTTSNSMLLSGIQPSVTVDFEVRTKIGNVVSRPRELRQRTFPTPPGPVRDFKVISFDSDQIRISFKAPESPNGLILAYLVSVQGSKPGEPSDSAFQTITALPNDIQFDQIISPLKAGYTYILSIQATNTEGSGDPVYLDPITLPIKAPFFSGQQVPFADFVLQVTSSTISIRFPKSLFSNKYGVVTAYTVIVVEEGANQTAVAILPSYQQIRGRAIWPVYQTSEPFNPFNTARRRRQTVSDDSVDFVVGKEETCPSFGYCNGALDPISQYRVRVRAYTENGLFTDAPWSDVITTKFDPWWFVYALIPFMIIVLIIAFIMCLCACVAGDKKQKPAKRPQRREKSMEAFPSQANENANNIYGTSSSQERLTPDTPPPKRGPKSRPVEVVKFSQHVRKLSSKLGDNFGKEYEDLNLIGESHAKTVGNLAKNEDKNRYNNIVPFDFNRICLDKEEDYINASSVTGFNGANEYIASQGPQDNTVNDFWQMIWEQNTPAIAVIGRPVENGRVKFVQYWPSDSTPITFGNVTVNKVSEREETKHGYIVRDFCLESGSEVRALRQFSFIAWPDHGVPKSSNQMLNFVRAVRSALPQNAKPLLVHCGAGIGRTGVFVGLDILTQHLSLDEKYIDVFGTVAREREERTNMVQTVHQYEFLHRALLDILEGRVAGPNWVLKSKRRTSVDSDQIAADEIGEASL